MDNKFGLGATYESSDDDLEVNLTLDEDGNLSDGDEIEVEAPDGRAVSAPAVPPEDDDDLEVEFVDEDDPEAQAKGDGEDDDDEYEDVEPDEKFAQEWTSNEQQARINQAEAHAMWTQAQAQAQVAQSNLTQVNLGLETVEQRRAFYQDALERAQEDEDFGRISAIQTSLSELNQIEGQLRQAQAEIPDPQHILAYGQQQAQQIMSRRAPTGKSVGKGVSTNNPLAERWAKANTWMSENADANQFLLNQSKQMVESGWNPNERGYYAELSRRIKSRFPQLQVKSLAAKKGRQQGQARPRGAVAPTRSRSGTPPRQSGPSSRKGRYTLTKADVAAMRRMALDPKNVEHRREFAASRMETAGDH